MKKGFKIIGIVIAVAIVIYGIKFIRDATFSGNEEIKIIENYNEVSSINELVQLSEFKGKVLYIDLWGVYCEPCIKQFEYLPELKEKYKEENIEFVYLATPYGHFDDVQKWKEFMKRYNLIGHHILMSIEFYNNIWEDMPEMKNPFMIPHYLIINKKGEVVNPNAPRPGNKQALYSEIDNLI